LTIDLTNSFAPNWKAGLGIPGPAMFYDDLEGSPEVPVNSKDSTPFWGDSKKTLFPSNLDRTEGTCLESAVDLLILKPS
jgi:hypothetical protein